MSDYSSTDTSTTFAREIKFLLDPSAARAVRDWARARLTPDVHGGGPAGDEYATSTLYFDTEDFDVFHRRGSFGRSKYRVRRYGASDLVFFERKLRTRGVQVKRRTAAAIVELPRLGEAGSDRTWPIRWFHRRLSARRLRPICRVSYQRVARGGMTGFGPVRLTLDDRLIASATRDLSFNGGNGTAIVPGHALLELKFSVAMPPVFVELVTAFGLIPRPISKYRLGMMALGCATERAARVTTLLEIAEGA